MNLYSFHTNPESLKHHDAAHEKLPDLAWNKYAGSDTELKKREHLWAKDADKAVMYAMHVLNGRFKKGEPAILKDPFWTRVYAKEVIKGMWLEGEDTIAKSAYDSFVYAQEVLRGRFIKGEDTIRNSRYNAAYVNFLLKVNK